MKSLEVQGRIEEIAKGIPLLETFLKEAAWAHAGVGEGRISGFLSRADDSGRELLSQFRAFCSEHGLEQIQVSFNTFILVSLKVVNPPRSRSRSRVLQPA